MDELINQASLVGKSIKNTIEYKRLVELRSIIDEKYEKEITEFKKQNEEYNRLVSINDKYSNKYKEALKKFVEAKNRLYQKEEVIEYIKNERIIQTRLNALSKNIAEVVSDNIKVPNEIGIIQVEKKHGK